MHLGLASLLFQWREFAGDGGTQVRRWSGKQLSKNGNIVQFARAFTSHGWSHSITDRVSKRTTLAQINGLDSIIDIVKLRKRLGTVIAARELPEADLAALSEFSEAWKRFDNHEIE